MNSQGFLLLNLICIFGFAWWYWRSRESASKKPTQLNLRAADSEPVIITPASVEPALAEVDKFSQSKNLNVIFNYNSHTWDAYEVLGIPAGSPMKDVTHAYQQALRNSDPKSHAFLETAYKSILNRL